MGDVRVLRDKLPGSVQRTCGQGWEGHILSQGHRKGYVQRDIRVHSLSYATWRGEISRSGREWNNTYGLEGELVLFGKV